MSMTMTPSEAYKRVVQQHDATVFLDIRDPDECAIAKIDGAVCIPLNELKDRLDELAKTAEIICVCHHGVRSAAVAEFLQQNGFPIAKSMEGGIDAWSVQIDTDVPQVYVNYLNPFCESDVLSNTYLQRHTQRRAA